MESFRKSQAAVIRKCRNAKGVLILFDFDGTLSPIVDHPENARMLPGWRERLVKLNRRRDVVVGIVTGRSLADIRARARVPGIVYAASHGFEIAKGSRSLLSIGARHYQPMKKLADEVEVALADIPNTQLEYKRTSLAVHYRRVKETQRTEVKRRIKATAEPYLEQHGWKVTGGKMVIEVRPAEEWNKGSAALWIANHLAKDFIPCYIGDDVTDEDAFAALGKSGITIRIGIQHGSAARYFVRRVDEIIPWLNSLMRETT